MYVIIIHQGDHCDEMELTRTKTIERLEEAGSHQDVEYWPSKGIRGTKSNGDMSISNRLTVCGSAPVRHEVCIKDCIHNACAKQYAPKELQQQGIMRLTCRLVYDTKP